MKKFIKLIVIVLIIAMLLISINFIRNYMILKKIINRGNEILNSSNYHITIESVMPNGNFEAHNDIYYKDKICLIRTTTSNNEAVEVYWKNYSTKEDNSYYINQEDIIESNFNDDLISSIKSSLSLDYITLFKKSLFSIISVKNNCYIIDNGYYDKDTGTLREIQLITNNDENNELNLTQKYTIELNTVTDEDISKPEI